MKTKLGCAALVLTLLVLAVWGFYAYANRLTMSAMGPKVKAALREMASRSYTLDPREIEAQPFSPATVTAVETVHARYRDVKEAAVDFVRATASDVTSRPAGSTAKSITLKELSRFDPMTTAFLELVAQPDYELSAFAAVPLDPSAYICICIPEHDHQEMASLTKIVKQQSRNALEAGRTAKAMDLAQALVRASHLHRFSPLSYHQWSSGILNQGTEAWLRIVDECDDQGVLRQALEQQTSLVSSVTTLTSDAQVIVLDASGFIREGSRSGIRPQRYGGSGLQILGEGYRVQAEFMERSVLPSATNPERIQSIRRGIDHFRSGAVACGAKARSVGELATKVLDGPSFRAIAASGSLDRGLGVIQSSQSAKCRFDLLRVTTAAKLYRLEKGRYPASVHDLIPKYLPGAPIDVYSPKPKPYHLLPEPYSVGPDGIDQKAALLYNPTNGMISPGDMVLRVEKR